ncbi:MAG TPA: glycosyltransferase family 87 protein [Candidatus Acidoferrum sp.]|nr:glycosyltransferase family 87 protein [Candidatus Acidoferrum sp.]
MADFAAYYAAGKVWAHDGDPYGTDVWQVQRTLPNVDPTREELIPFVGPPLGLPLWALLAKLPYTAAMAVWGTFLVACVAVILYVPVRLARRKLSLVDAVALLFFACACGPLVIGVAFGQAALPATAGVALAILFISEKRWRWAAGAATFAALFKPHLALALVGAVRCGAATVAFAVAALGSLIGNALPGGGIAGLLRYLALLPEQTASERFYVYQFLPTSIAYSFGLARSQAVHVGTIITALTVVVTTLVVWRSRASLVDGLLIVCAALPFALPYVHEYDLSVALLPGFVALYRARGPAWLLAACGLILLAVEPFALGYGHAGLAFSVITAATVALEIAALTPGLYIRFRLAPLAVIPVVLCLGLGTPAATPLPMWPADLPPDFRAADGTTAQAVWKHELIAVGLQARHPWDALLRCITLSGCILVGAAMTMTTRAGSRREAANA